ncbi:MAG: flavodoxin family protein [bacterium]|nr:flavodoxin family protein [bacterium]MCX7917361.1 flavodoxin family protein [bacterium]MDW8164767.1 flavodoxin family protein [Candidatus Omnitrophota bacterium]
MKICAFLGSPRKTGNTNKILELTINELKNLGHEIETVYLIEKNIKGCIECFECQKIKDKPNCSINDDMQNLYEKILNSDCIIIASPVFCWSFSWLIKSFIDRTFCFDKYNEDGTYISLVEGKKCGLILTSAGDEFEGPDLVVESYLRMVEYHKMEDIGRIVIANILSEKDIFENPEVYKKIKKFVENLK